MAQKKRYSKKRYKRDTYIFDGSIEIEETGTGRYGAPGERREKRDKATPEQIKKQNQWRRERDIRRIIKRNFQENDYWITLTYRLEERPPGMKGAQKDITALLDKLRKKYKKAGYQLKWILATEIGSRGGVHHHLIINRIPEGDIIISNCWTKGKAHIELMYSKGGYKDLAEYIAKQPEEENAIKEKRYSRSRNLVVPEPKRKELNNINLEKEPKPPKGYYIEKDSLVEGINPVTGKKYRYYTCTKIQPKRRI